MFESHNISILIPCLDESQTIEKVISDFRAQLPEARIIVCDNGSSDNTAEIARSLGARVIHESRRGKGNAVRRMLADVDADVYVMVDGDDTYPASEVKKMVAQLLDGSLDLVNGVRDLGSMDDYRPGHILGNRMFTWTVRQLFGTRVHDLLTGYRVMSRRFVKSFPILSKGFDIETELSIHALHLQMPIGNVIVPYKDRPEGSFSKLSTFKDGFVILFQIFKLVKNERPFFFFSILATISAVVSLVLGWPVVAEYFVTGLVPRFPTAILAMGIMILAFIFFTCGVISHSVTHGRLEQKRLAYLMHQSPSKHA